VADKSIYHAIPTLSAQFIAHQLVIIVEHRRQITRLFQLETDRVSRCFNLKHAPVDEAQICPLALPRSIRQTV
jgi:hypothetical protein